MSEQPLHERFVPPLWREYARMAITVIRGHRMRSALVIVGVGIGVTTLMAMVTILKGIGKQLEGDLQASEEVTVTLSKWDFLSFGSMDEAKHRSDLTPEDAWALDELCPAIKVSEFYIDPDRGRIIRYRGRKTRPVFVGGAGRHLPVVYKLPLDRGRYFTAADIERGRSVIVLGAGPASVLFPDGDALGKQVRIEGRQFEVVGTFAKRKSLFGEAADSFAYTPWTTYKKHYEGIPELYYIYLTVEDGWTQEDVEDQARSVMRMRHRLKAGEDDDFAITTSDRIEAFTGRITGAIALALVVLSSIGLLVGGIGVMNIMLISVTERTSEIGLRKAIGAQGRDILVQILMEAATLTGIGGMAGFLVSIPIALGVSAALGVPSGLSFGYAALAILFSALVGIVCGLYPAWRAARLDPIESLRHE